MLVPPAQAHQLPFPSPSKLSSQHPHPPLEPAQMSQSTWILTSVFNLSWSSAGSAEVPAIPIATLPTKMTMRWQSWSCCLCARGRSCACRSHRKGWVHRIVGPSLLRQVLMRLGLWLRLGLMMGRRRSSLKQKQKRKPSQWRLRLVI